MFNIPMKIQSNLDDLPEEIMLEILVRLSVKSVGRFRCVSKSWRSLLSQPEFIRAHLRRSKSRQQSLLLLNYSRCSLFYASLEDGHRVLDKIIVSGTKLHFARLRNSWFQIHGACDGLFLVTDVKSNVFVLNPITREIRHVPPPQFIKNVVGGAILGFGYDSVSNDYKIVAFACCCYRDVGMDAHVYSLKTGSWARVASCPCRDYIIGFRYEPSVFASGHLNWLVYDSEKSVILTFDLEDEKFTKMSLPDSVALGKLFCDVLSGCLCIYNKRDRDVWVMNEYGVHKSWVKSTINDPKNQKHMLILKKRRYVIYDLKKETLEEMAIDDIADAKNYVQGFPESLVSPHGNDKTRND